LLLTEKYFSPEMVDKVSVVGVELLRAPVRLTQVAEVVFLPQVLEQHVLVKKPRPTTTMYPSNRQNFSIKGIPYCPEKEKRGQE
jgi:hypothetical protein